MLECALIVLLLVIALEDFRYRAVSWFLFPLLLAASVGYTYPRLGGEAFWTNAGCNAGFTALQLAVVTAYFSLKRKTLVNLTAGYLGEGDILFLGNLCFVFSPFNYCLFYFITLSGIVAMVLLRKGFADTACDKIPLAGIQAFVLAGVWVADWRLERFACEQDYWLTQLMPL